MTVVMALMKCFVLVSIIELISYLIIANICIVDYVMCAKNNSNEVRRCTTLYTLTFLQTYSVLIRYGVISVPFFPQNDVIPLILDINVFKNFPHKH